MATPTSISKLISSTATSLTEILTGRVWPASIRWRGATTAGHTCVISDSADVVLWSSVAGGVNNVEESDLGRKWTQGTTGIKVIMGSGTVDLYYKG